MQDLLCSWSPETNSTGLGKGLGHIWAGSSETPKVEQGLEGLGPHVGNSLVPVKRNALEEEGSAEDL